MTRYTIDTSHSNVEFSIRHLVIARVRGRFTRFEGVLELDPTDITRSKVTADIEVASISTNEDKRDAHLRSADFFDADTYPRMTFVSKRVEMVGPHLHVTGDLTIRGTTREVVLRVEQLGLAKDPWGNQRAAFSASTSIDRKEFGLHWNQVLEAGGVMVGDKVEISLDVEAVQATALAAA
ncbi:MAG: YceI family protein [Kofleriaceae bacterium]|nr:MAG: YceI family protein [Kofleriaceae bacterium]MBZ0231892.1 YceI family protein [Kofleriaceae bacterium]